MASQTSTPNIKYISLEEAVRLSKEAEWNKKTVEETINFGQGVPYWIKRSIEKVKEFDTEGNIDVNLRRERYEYESPSGEVRVIVSRVRHAFLVDLEPFFHERYDIEVLRKERSQERILGRYSNPLRDGEIAKIFRRARSQYRVQSLLHAVTLGIVRLERK